MDLQFIATAQEQVRRQRPLVHNITNLVVTNIVANALLAIGASPVMAYAKEEVADVASVSAALALNMGTLDERVVEAMEIAAKAANSKGVPIIFDPVGVGFTAYRNEVATRLINQYELTVVRGNAAEIGYLVGAGGTVKGVDSIDAGDDLTERMLQYAKVQNCVMIATGAIDYVTDGDHVWALHNGDELLGSITGSGCMLTGVIGAFIGVQPRFASRAQIAKASIAAITSYNVAGELAVLASKGPGTLQSKLFDELYHQQGESLVLRGRVEQLY
ncbi:hydroxyethylthiazole kinase [Sulfoacidibacillus thermotolerans]|uniref:Hydroxyethylthiazole kinase n=1 Tax=Sulfoacidibacillus thermotolerans TaxID=1765684 RepID=A0A2U3DBW4_SULT2|nr:hydroxyethylthiazole kinase [Sulfoacidibacillus thermotolerans]PWI58770.1 hydroxyethylthiazole kinase [Sulfoacidibacillus thermotolerans]